MGSSVLISFFLGGVQLLIALILISSNKLDVLFGINILAGQSKALGLGLIILLLTWVIFGSFGGILHRLMIPVGLLYQSQWWGLLYKVTQFLSIISTVILGGNILDVCIVYSAVQAVIYSLTFIYIKKKIPLFYPWWQLKNWKTAFTNFRKSIVLTINNIAQQLSNSGLILFIANIFQTSMVPPFTTVRMLTNTAGSLANVFISSLSPDIVRYYAKGEERKLLAAQNANWFFSGSIVNIGLILVLPFIETFYKIWTKGILDFNFSLFLFLAASVSFVNFGSGLFSYLKWINHLTSQTIITLTRVALIFGVSYLFIKPIGFASIGLGVLVAESFGSAILPIIFVNQTIRKFNSHLELKYLGIPIIPPLIISALPFIYLSGTRDIIILSAISFMIVIITYLVS